MNERNNEKSEESKCRENKITTTTPHHHDGNMENFKTHNQMDAAQHQAYVWPDHLSTHIYTILTKNPLTQSESEREILSVWPIY